MMDFITAAAIAFCASLSVCCLLYSYFLGVRIKFLDEQIAELGRRELALPEQREPSLPLSENEKYLIEARKGL